MMYSGNNHTRQPDPFISVCIIEDDEIIRKGYVSLLQPDPDFFLSGDYPSVEAALKHLEKEGPDILLLDIQLPGMKGVDALPVIKKILPQVRIIMLTVHESPEFIFTALKNGASGYLTKNTPFSKIKEHIKEVANGGGVMSAGIALQVMQHFQKNFNTPLSKRETEILERVADGKSRSKIATELFIDLETVKSHIKNIYHKLDVNSRDAAIKVAREERYI